MKHRITGSRQKRTIRLILLSLLVLGLSSIIRNVKAGVEAPPIDFENYSVVIYGYNPGTAEADLFKLVKSDLEYAGFQPETIQANLSSPGELLQENPEIDFLIVLTVVEEDNPTYTAIIYSPRKSDPKKILAASQLNLSAELSQYIKEQAAEAAIKEEDDLSTLAYKDYREGNYDAAIEKFNKVLETDPGQWRIHYYLYLCYTALNNPEKQWEYIQNGLEIDPQNELLLLSKGNFYFRSGNYIEAQKYYLPLIDSLEQGQVSRYNLSLAYERQGDYKAARQVLTEAAGVNWGKLNLSVQNQLLRLKQIEEQRIKSLFFVTAGVILVAIIVVATVISIRNQRKARIALDEKVRGNAQLETKSVLLQTLNDGMNMTELRELCFILGLDWENLNGTTKKTKSISLIEYYSNRKEMDKLQEEIVKIRPDLNFGS